MGRKPSRRSCDLSWRDYFKDPSQWWDNRTSKAGPAYPDFRHKVTKKCLRLDGCYTPSWVVEELRRRGLAMPAQAQNEKVTHHQVLLCNDEGTSFVALLRSCAKNKDLFRGTRLHHDVLKKGLLEKCSDALVIMYAKCGALARARQLLDMHKSRDVFPWTALISGYARKGQGQNALNCFEQMQHEGLTPDAVTFASLLKACGSIGAADKGERFHDEIARQGLLGNDVVLGNALVDMYAKCGALAKAHQVLEELPVRDVFSWSALIQGYAQQGQGEQALNCFERMQWEGLSPDRVTFLCILKACGSIGATHKGEQIHDKIAEQGLLGDDIVLGNALVDMYAKCGALSKAQQVLEELPVRDVVSWSATITGYAQQGQADQALNCFEQMQCEGLSPDAVTFLCILKVCGSVGEAEMGELIHEEIGRLGLLRNNIVLGNALVAMYVKCGALAKAQRVLEELSARDAVSWSALITGYAQQGQAEHALNCFDRMQCEGISPNAVTFLCILKACGIIGAVDKGEQIHDEIARQGLLGNDIMLGTALVDMYAKSGALAKAQRVLEELPIWDVVSWNALIGGYAQHGQGEQALTCFEQMQCKGISPDAVTMVGILKACGIVGLVDNAQTYFANMSTKYGIKPRLEHYTCMVDVFGRAGHLDKALDVIQKMPTSDYSIALWSALLGACRKWEDVAVGRWAFEQAVQVDKSDVTAYTLMANVYAAAFMQEDAENIEWI